MKTIIAFIIAVVAVIVYINNKQKNMPNLTFKQKLLKSLYPYIMKKEKSKKNEFSNSDRMSPSVSFYSLSILLNNDSLFNFSSAEGKKVVIVNTASDCGFTAQYEQLEQLHQAYGDRIVMIGIPSNEFGNQERKSDQSIAEFCKVNFGVSFLLAKKSTVLKKSGQIDLYKWLSNSDLNGWNNNAPTWNFCKYIVNEKGVLTHFFKSAVDPMGLEFKEALRSDE